LTWRETGGPRVVAPARRGFGARLLEQGLAEELRGRVRLEFRPEGVLCVVEAALAA
jgi:two-component sensor histidine kinase